MRRALVPLVFVLTVLALGVLPGSAGAIACPQGSADTTDTTCCGPPTPAEPATAAVPKCCPGGCCDTSTTCCTTACCGSGAEPACVSPSLTIATSPDPSVAGRRVTVSGRLTGGSAGATVELWQELPGQSSFQRVASTSTNAAGDYSFVRAAGVVQMNTSWYASATGALSQTIVEHVDAVIRLAASSAHPAAGKAVTFSGHVSPAHGGERIVLQERTSRGWRTIGSALLGSRSRFSLRHRFAHRGALVLRALLAADPRNVQSASAPVRISVH